MYTMLQKLLNQSLIKVSLCSIVSIALLSNGVVNSAVMFKQQAIAQTKTNIGVQGQNQTGQIISNKILEVRLLADTLGNRLNKSAAVLQVTSKLPQVTNVSSANSISHELHGIPSNADLPKRSVAKEILASDSDIPVVFFNMPNGNFYLEEPYSHQKNLTTDSAASREFFKGAVETHGMFLSGIFVSDSSGLREAAITVPIYRTNGSLVGVWGGAIALDGFNKSLQTLNLTNKERILYIDQHGQKVSDSDKQLSNKIESFANLQSFKNAMTGKLGSNIETINGTRMFVAYSPVRIDSTTWVVLLMDPIRDNGKGFSR
jgi:Cache domain